MSREELQQKSRFAMIGTLMTIVSLVFLFYVGSSLLNTTKKYKDSVYGQIVSYLVSGDYLISS